MTDYTTTANQGLRPWSGELERGDRLTIHQAAAIDVSHLADWGLMLERIAGTSDHEVAPYVRYHGDHDVPHGGIL